VKYQPAGTINPQDAHYRDFWILRQEQATRPSPWKHDDDDDDDDEDDDDDDDDDGGGGNNDDGD
jgi:hypothetical protein